MISFGKKKKKNKGLVLNELENCMEILFITLIILFFF